MTDNSFRTFWDLGYHRLVPIVPPDAEPSPTSSLFKRKHLLGKIPGVRKANGTWIGVDLTTTLTTEADLETWHAMGAGVGIRTGNGLVALDIDTMDEALADRAQQLALDHLGIAPIRIGNWPKRLLLFRVFEETPYRRVKFAGGLVELLSDDRQFVAHGIHPITGRPYTWQPHCWPYDSLTEVSAEQLARYFGAVASEFPAAETVTGVIRTGSSNVDQRQLLGEPDAVARAVEALPNTTELFPSYDDYVRVGYAIKGATQDDSGLELFQQWASKWPEGNDPEVVEADWHRMKPPFSVGAQYLYSLASKHSGGNFNSGDAWFAPASASSNPFDTPGDTPRPAIEPIRWADLLTWRTQEAPAMEWDVADFIPRGRVTLLYGEGGVGKTLAIHQYAVAAASGRQWLGQATRPARVMCVFCEDEDDELHRRHRSILKAVGVDGAEADANLRIVSRAGEDNLLVTFSRSNGAMQRTPFWHQLRAEAADWKADVIVLDTIADIYGGSEIDRMQVNSFVKVGLAGLGAATGASVIALGHPSVAGRTEGRSGSTAWSNASRSRLYLRRPKGKEKGNLRELEGMKSNRSAVGSLLQIKWQAGAFALVAESKPIDLNAFKNDMDGSTRAPSVEEREEAAVLAALGAARAEQIPLSLSARSWKTYAPKVLRASFPELMDMVRTDDGLVDGMIRKLLSGGRVREATWREPATRNAVSGFDVVTAATAVAEGGVFN